MKKTQPHKNLKTSLFTLLHTHRHSLILLVLFAFHMFFRIYQLESRANFDWDQVDNAWATRRILVEKNYPLIGMQAKLNSGLYIGPLYYYLISPIYAATKYDPIASPIIAALSSMIGFFILYFVVSRLFTRNTAYIALIINACALSLITSDKVQWPVNFIAPLFLLLFYSLVRSLQGKTKHLLFAGIVIGLLANTHFSAIFGVISFFLILPFVPRTKQTLVMTVLSLCLMGLFISPVIVYISQLNGSGSIESYIAANSHGFHLRRFFQLTYDAVIKFEEILYFKALRSASFFLLPLFYAITVVKTKQFHLVYVTILFFSIPWILFSMYKGEISNYYFDSTKGLVIMILAVTMVWAWNRKILVLRMALGLLCFTWVEWNLQQFFLSDPGTLPKTRIRVRQAIEQGRRIEFVHGVPDSYLFEIESKKK